MKFLKSILSFSIPLLAVLITFSLYLTTKEVVDSYKKNIINDYAIMVITNTPLIEDDIQTLADIEVDDIYILKKEEILENLKEKLSKNSLTLLKQKLPYFYKISLKDYPTTSELKQIKEELQLIPNIKKVETFSSDHSKIYSLLILCERIVTLSFIFIFVFAVLLLSKQIKIWFFEHNERITIIKYHGGSIFYSALPIIKISLVSSIFSSIVAIAIVFLTLDSLDILLTPEIFNIIPNTRELNINFIEIVFMSFLISIIPIVGVLVKNKIHGNS